MNTHVPHVPYLETILGEAEANHRHKKQTGGRGQFGEVHLRVRPRERGEGFNFVDAVKGGTIPNQFIPAVEKGVREQMEKGVISGNQVVDVEVEVFFGKDHPVDSSEQAFKTAVGHRLPQGVRSRRGRSCWSRSSRSRSPSPARSSATSRPTCPPAAGTSPAWTRSPATCRSSAPRSRWPRCSPTPRSSRA